MRPEFKGKNKNDKLINSCHYRMEFPRGCIALNNITLNGKTGNFALHKPEGKAVQFYDLSDPRNFFLKSEIEKSEKAYAHKHPAKKQSDKDQENNQSAKPKSLKKKR